MSIVTIIAAGNSLAAIIPKAYLKSMGWKRGDRLEIAIVEGSIRLRNITQEWNRLHEQENQVTAG